MVDEKVKEKVVSEILNGKSPVDIVIEFGLPPEEVERIYREVVGEQEESIDVDIPNDILALFVLASAVTTLDIITTRIALLHPYTYEINPFMSTLMSYFGVEYALLLNVLLSSAGIILLTLLSVKYLDGYMRYVPLTLYTALRLIPVVANYKILLGLFS